MSLNIGRLEKVDLKTVWSHESQNFTPWLAQQESLVELGEILFMELEFAAKEKSVGSFRADILCKNLSSQNWVVIENQLSKTDHNHLGQLLTYAAGLNDLEGKKVEAVVWIAKEFLPEHRAVLDRLNEISGGQMQFFGLEIELWKIGTSLPAPKFNLVCKPNTFSNNLKRLVSMNETDQWQYEYWEDFKKYFENKNEKPLFEPSSGIQTHCLRFNIKEPKFQLNTTVNTIEDRIGVEIVIPDSKESFKMLESQKEQIEREFGESLDWQDNPNSKVSRIVVYKYGVDIWNKEDWPNQFEWLSSRLKKFKEVFLPRIRKLTTTEKIFEETT
jgi:hypothetical protein